MTQISREDIQIISRHSNLSEDSINNILRDELYNNSISWKKFLRLFFMSLGIGFTTAGIIFFFAFNWDQLHKFIKIGLIEGLIVLITFIALFSNIKSDFKNILLTGSSILVGVLFAVFGQIYQTGANAYDFFLSWTMFISLWVFVSFFPPLWLVYIALINTTLVLYAQQVAQDWSGLFVINLLLIINVLFLLCFLFGSKVISKIKSPGWFINILVLTCAVLCTIGFIIGIYDDYQTSFPTLIIITLILYGLGIKYGLEIKNGFYLAVIPFSIIVIISALLLKISDGEVMFFLVSLFIIASITLVISNLIKLQKKWINE